MQTEEHVYLDLEEQSRYYHLTLVSDGNKYFLDRQWGSLSDPKATFTKQDGPFSTRAEGMAAFDKAYEMLTGQTFSDYKSGATLSSSDAEYFIPQKGKQPPPQALLRCKPNISVPTVGKGNAIVPESPLPPAQPPSSQATPILLLEEEDEEDEDYVPGADEAEEVSEEETPENGEEDDEEEEADEDEGGEEEDEEEGASEKNEEPDGNVSSSPVSPPPFSASQSVVTIGTRERSTGLMVMIKSVFELPTEEQRLQVLDRLPDDVKQKLTFMLGSILFSMNDTPASPINPVPLETQAAVPKSKGGYKGKAGFWKKKQSATTPTTKTKKNSSVPATTTTSEQPDHPQDQHSCTHLFVRGPRKGSPCGAPADKQVGDRWACSKHEALVTKAVEGNSKKKSTAKTSTAAKPAPKLKSKQPLEKPDIVMSRRVHLCDTKDACDICANAKLGDVKVSALPHKETRTPGEVSGFLKCTIMNEESKWTLVFITMDTGFRRWDERWNIYNELKKMIDAANMVRYIQFDNGRSSYKFTCDPMKSFLPLEDLSVATEASELTKKETASEEPALQPENSATESVQSDSSSPSPAKEVEEASLSKDSRPQEKKATRSEQRELIRSLLRACTRQAGDEWNLVEFGWFNRWKDYVNYDASSLEKKSASISEHPGEIDNSPLFSSDGTLRDQLQEGLDFFGLPPSCWERLVSWYQGGPAVLRPLVQSGQGDSSTVFELCEITVNIVTGTQKDIEVSFPSSSTVEDLIAYYHAHINTAQPKDSIKVYRYFQEEKRQHYEDTSITLEEAGICDGSSVFME